MPTHDAIDQGRLSLFDLFPAHPGRVLQVLVSVVCQDHLAWLYMQLGSRAFTSCHSPLPERGQPDCNRRLQEGGLTWPETPSLPSSAT